jgi:hypothetical protein
MRIGNWDDWTRSMMVLEEDLFFELIRNYLGKIQTPFYKPNLVQRLMKFLQEEETVEAVKSHFSPQDAVILSAIGMIPGADIRKLQNYFGDSWEYLNLFHTIRNLQERLLIYWSKGEQPGWYLSPIFLAPQWEGYLGLEALFPAEIKGGTDPTLVWLGSGFILGLKSFISHKKIELDLQGNLKKRSFSAFEEIFGAFQEGALLREGLLQRSLDTLTNIGLFELHGRRYRVNEHSWADFWAMAQAKKLALLWASWLLKDYNEALAFASDLLSFLTYFSDGSYAPDHFLRFHLIKDYSWPMEEGLLPEMVTIGLLNELELEDGRCVYSTNPAALDLLQVETEVSFVPIASTFSFSIDLHNNSPQASMAATLGEIQKFDYLSSLLLGQKGVYQFLEYYPQGPAPGEILEEFSGGKLPSNILFSLKDWEELFGAIKVERVLVVSFDQESMGFFRSIPGFTDLFLREIAEGVFLMKADQMNLLEEILEEQNRPIPPIIDHLYDKVHQHHRWSFFPWELRPGLEKKAIKENLQLESKAFTFPDELNEEEVEDYKSRISRGLILRDNQIQPSLHPWEKTSAQGLDFRGKIRLIEAAIKDKKWLLELQILGSDPTASFLLNPRYLDKKGKDTILIGELVPSLEEFQTKVSKIAHVKKVRMVV